MTQRHSVTVLRGYARELNNRAYHLEEDASQLRKEADSKTAEAAEMRANAKAASDDADRLEARP